jgi:hypothetical protein
MKGLHLFHLYMRHNVVNVNMTWDNLYVKIKGPLRYTDLMLVRARGEFHHRCVIWVQTKPPICKFHKKTHKNPLILDLIKHESSPLFQ